MTDKAVTIKRRSPAIMRAMRALEKRQVLIGIPAEQNGRDGGSFENAAIGYLNEFGSPLQNIPPRPHLVPGVKRGAPDSVAHLKAAAQGAVKGDVGAVDAGLHKAGLVCQAAVKMTIADVLTPRLVDSTLEARQRKGHAGASPLIDTGEYLNSITYVIREKGK